LYGGESFRHLGKLILVYLKIAIMKTCQPSPIFDSLISFACMAVNHLVTWVSWHLQFAIMKTCRPSPIFDSLISFACIAANDFVT
jgi:hypothetical protein